MAMSQSNEKPTILFVHGNDLLSKSLYTFCFANKCSLGAWHNSTCWDSIRSQLSQFSYPTRAVQLPSSGNAVSSHLEDTAVVRNALEPLIVSDGKPVILVMHSYGGIAGTNAVSGLEMAARVKKGEKGGIVHCLFIAAFLVPKGLSLIGMFPEPPPYLAPDVGPPHLNHKRLVPNHRS